MYASKNVSSSENQLNWSDNPENQKIFSHLIEQVNILFQRFYERKITREQSLLLTSLWEGLSFERIAERNNYQSSRLRLIADALWDSLSYFLDEDINIDNFKSILQQHYPLLREKQDRNLSVTDRKAKKNDSSNIVELGIVAKSNDLSSFIDIEPLIQYINKLLKSHFKRLLTDKEQNIIYGIYEALSYEEIAELINCSESNLKKIVYNLFSNLEVILGTKITKKGLLSTLIYHYNQPTKTQQNTDRPSNTIPRDMPTAYISSKNSTYQPIPIQNSSSNRDLVLLIQLTSTERYEFQNLYEAPILEVDPNASESISIDKNILEDAVISVVKNLPYLREDETITVPIQLKIN